jgi:hypothetical protein
LSLYMILLFLTIPSLLTCKFFPSCLCLLFLLPHYFLCIRPFVRFSLSFLGKPSTVYFCLFLFPFKSFPYFSPLFFLPSNSQIHLFSVTFWRLLLIYIYSYIKVLHVCIIFHACRMSHQPQPPSLDHHENTFGRMQPMKFDTIQFPPSPDHFLSLS